MTTLRRSAGALLALFFICGAGTAAGWLAAASPAAAAPAASPSASSTASPAPEFGADLGAPTDFAVADTLGACSNGFQTQSEVLKCPTAVQNHQLIFVWKFDASSCRSHPCAPPDGFNVVRSLNRGAGPATTFQPAAGNDLGAILQVTAADVVGSCFYVVPFRGTNDFGRKSNTVCINLVDHLRLPAKRIATAHSYSYDNGTSCKSPDSNPGGYALIGPGADGKSLIAGYVTRSGGTSVLGVLANPVDTLAQAIAIGEAASNAGNNTCNHYRDVFQGLIYFDLSPIAAKLSGRSIAKASLDMDVTAGAWNAGSPSGGDGTEHSGSPAPNCTATIGFPTNVYVGTDYTFPNRILFDTFAKTNGGVGKLSVDVTGMVRAWLHPGGVNRGVVLSPSYLDPTHPPAAGNTPLYNADCMSRYGPPTLSVDIM